MTENEMHCLNNCPSCVCLTRVTMRRLRRHLARVEEQIGEWTVERDTYEACTGGLENIVARDRLIMLNIEQDCILETIEQQKTGALPPAGAEGT